MSDTLTRIVRLVAENLAAISDHAYEKLDKRGLFADELFFGVANATLVEDYPTAPKGPSVLVLQHDFNGRPVHVLWGVPKGQEAPAVIITAYRPDPSQWSDDFMRRSEP
jgi:hypothetical protein